MSNNKSGILTVKGKVFTAVITKKGLFHWYFRKWIEQPHNRKLGTTAFDIMHVKRFICVI